MSNSFEETFSGKREEDGVKGRRRTRSSSPRVVKSTAIQEAIGGEEIPKKEMYVCGKISGKPCRIIFVTSSPVNLLEQELCPSKNIIRTRLDIRSTTGKKIKVYGKESLEVDIGGFSTVEDFYIVDMVEKGILGTAFLRKHRCIIDLSQNLPGKPKIHLSEPAVEKKKPEKEKEAIIPQHLEELYTRCSSG
ncbi:uncharacterized protein LOC128882800 isoform X2 [Hylaeus volcanicus]|uniref:uncharacterized protein LOC128882800 isoform X2 n=1 Tax=Hylaeus volcanicus TaxID=313075 RepID=UPI0023B872D3|nr:uncharacterized protein LOC128882800 isoform X2 [Hylaeus volcanicus]